MSVSPSWELIVLGGTVLTMEPESAPITEGAVAISNGKIAAVGPAEEMLEQAPTGEVLDASGCLVLPGLINTHSHLGMTVMRGLADDLALKEWLEEHIWPTEREHVNAETVRIGTELAAAEQLLGGVTTTTDMYFHGDVVAKAIISAGMRAVISEAVIDFGTPSCDSPEEMIAMQRRLIEQYRDHPLLVPSVAAHATYTVAAANLVKEAELSEEMGVPMQIHLSETRWEVEQYLEEKGVSPVAYLADLGVLSERTVAAHCVHLSPEDLDLLEEFEVGISHNPVSNLKLASGIAPVPAMLQRGLKVGLGTDGAVSNNTLDLLHDLRVAALMHKGFAGDPTVMPARTMIELATIGGARVLGLDNRLGTLSEGKEADLICIAMNGPHTTPIYDPFSHLVYASRSADIRHVLVAGNHVVRDHQLQTLDLEQIRKKAQQIADRMKG